MTTSTIDWYTDASANPLLGAGGYSGEDWFILQWEEDFIMDQRPSINYLELYAVAVSIYSWIYKYSNQKVTLFCDNMSVVHMINSNSSKCQNCMVLIRLIVLQCLKFNVLVTAKHVKGVQNNFADLLSRMNLKQFWILSRQRKKTFQQKTM